MSSYGQSVSFLNSFLNLEQVTKPHSRLWNLKRMRELYRIFNHPERGVFTIVVGGTKGKGSTAYFLSEILRHSGLRVGFYHSPHLEEARERIWIGGRPISRRDFSSGLLKIQRRLREIGTKSFTYFEILTLLASLLFKEKKVEAAVFEVGMGGRLDATHVLPSKLVILTPIHYDHEAFLGDTLAQIAREKAALLQRGREAVVAPQEPEVLREIKKVARKRNCPLLPPLHLKGIRIRLLGDFQKLNAAMAIRAAQVLRNRHQFLVTGQAIKDGVSSNHWPGRMEFFKARPSFLLDGAHNPKSIEALSRNVSRLFRSRRKILVFGTSRDKRSDRMFPHLSKVFKVCLLTRSDNSRAKEVAALLAEARGYFPTLIPTASSKEALSLARKLARPNDLIVVTGSFYLIGEVRSQCRT
jgi:dihydrofolate synthase/folylpolyglutamate synthase